MSNSRQQGLYYGEYLKIPSLLNLQHPKSAEGETPAHDETLFIIVHQVYELWFKQIIHELKSVRALFLQDVVEEMELFTVVQRMLRVNKIQGLLHDQLAIMETMTPMDFLEFRDLLIPASGFQSVQFREIQIMTGGPSAKGEYPYFFSRLNLKDREHLRDIARRPSLLELLEKWLGRIPFLFEERFDFWQQYCQVVEQMLEQDRQVIGANLHLSEKQREDQLENLLSTIETFKSLFDAKAYQQQVNQGVRRFSQKAMLGACLSFFTGGTPCSPCPTSCLIFYWTLMRGWPAGCTVMP